jgi:hypothetical protein
MAMSRLAYVFEARVKAVLCAVLLLAAASPASAECVTVPVWRERVAALSPTLVIDPAEMVNASLQAIVTGSYNAAAPQAQLTPDSVIMLLARDRSTGLPLGQALFGLFKGGCIRGTFLVPLPFAHIGDPV